MARRPDERRQKTSLWLDPDLIRWIKRKADAEDVSESHIARRYLRAAMDAELTSDEDVTQ